MNDSLEFVFTILKFKKREKKCPGITLTTYSYTLYVNHLEDIKLLNVSFFPLWSVYPSSSSSHTVHPGVRQIEEMVVGY
jgi:hypothetical protein